MDKDITRGIKYCHSEDGTKNAVSIPGSLKMEAWDYMVPLTSSNHVNSIVEVQFKNTHKGYYLNPNGLDIKKGDIVVVESQPGIDIGVVTLEENLVRRKIRTSSFRGTEDELKKVLRRPNQCDIERWQEAISLEQNTMIRSRQIAVDLGLDMKIGDVEYQADKMKAIFYYIADGRVDFRELIKVLAEQFRLRVEMKQIGARQEAGRIGGIGSCGRELCCSSWQTSFSSVSINAARVQDISPNPQKLAGQCGKLKCCLNYEADVYDDAKKSLPSVKHPLEALDGLYYLVKVDALRKVMWFSSDPQSQALQIPLSPIEVLKIQDMNRRGEKPDTLSVSFVNKENSQKVEHTFENVVGQDSLTRFDKSRTSKNKKHSNKSKQQTGNQQQSNQNTIKEKAQTQENNTPKDVSSSNGNSGNSNETIAAKPESDNKQGSAFKNSHKGGKRPHKWQGKNKKQN